MGDLVTTLTCPDCGEPSTATIPTDACVYFYECPGCKTLLRPKPGDCCVYCSYGDKRCPFVQDDVLCPDGPTPKL